MDKNKIIIIALIVVIVALLVGIVATMSVVDKTDTNVTYKGKSKITEGDPINLMLTAVNGTPLANQTVNITITDKDNSSDYHSVVTNVNGVGKLKLDKSAGEYTVFINYGGNENYDGSNFTKKIVIEDETVQAETTSTSSQSSSRPYSIDNLPPSNDPYSETRRYQIDENHVVQEYSDHYRSTVDLRTGERHGGFF